MAEEKENNFEDEVKESINENPEEQFKNHPEVINLQNELSGMSKDIIKKTTDVLRSEISQLSSSITQLKKKRAEHNSQARHYRAMRNNVSEEKAEIIDKLQTQANREKELRDKCNEEIKINKKRREELKDEIRTAWAKVKDLREKYYRMKDEVGVMPDELTNEIRELEWTQQTSSLSSNEDAEITKRIAELYEKAYTAHLIGYSSDELEKAVQHAKKLSQEHDQAHENVLANAEEGQKHHEKMIKLFDEINNTRAGGGDLHERYLDERHAADAAHQNIVEIYEKIKLKQYLLDIIDDEQIRRRHEKSQQMKEEQIERSKEKSASSKRLTLEELRLIMGEDEEEDSDE
ncbi:MAG: hypothetical protein EAX90_03290 [Candidatus Heimdallarchaeota archaeon]|nr:hypothetical protein [Candidatus Heimdallarchaeota archaeon]